MLLHTLQNKGLVHPPKWLSDNTHYLTAMGSVAYGVSGDMSDVDLYGFAFPPKDMVFPHLAGYVPGFGSKPPSFETWQEHHVKDGDKEYDFQIFSVVKYFDLLMDNNPNMVDSLFTPDRCVLHATRVAQLVRENRKTFLHKGCYAKFRGYAYAQLKKIKEKTGSVNPKRAASIDLILSKIDPKDLNFLKQELQSRLG
jgi:predicted nucleotidyltransferase